MPHKKKNKMVVETREAAAQAPIIRKDKDGNTIGSAYRDFLFSLEEGHGNDIVSLETDFLENGRLFRSTLFLPDTLVLDAIDREDMLECMRALDKLEAAISIIRLDIVEWWSNHPDNSSIKKEKVSKVAEKEKENE